MGVQGKGMGGRRRVRELSKKGNEQGRGVEWRTMGGTGGNLWREERQPHPEPGCWGALLTAIAASSGPGPPSLYVSQLRPVQLASWASTPLRAYWPASLTFVAQTLCPGERCVEWSVQVIDYCPLQCFEFSGNASWTAQTTPVFLWLLLSRAWNVLGNLVERSSKKSTFFCGMSRAWYV